MNFAANNIYHIYNRGNDRNTIFFNDRNYFYFLEKVRKYIFPHCDILAWVLMPNHFHLLIHANENSEIQLTQTVIPRNALSEGFRLLLSSYTKGINKQEGKTGNLIQQNTRSKCVYDVSNPSLRYATTCFTYIHQNPVRAGLVNKIEQWAYSSYKDYAGLRNGTLCNKHLANDLIDTEFLRTKTSFIIGEKELENIW